MTADGDLIVELDVTHDFATGGRARAFRVVEDLGGLAGESDAKIKRGAG